MAEVCYVRREIRTGDGYRSFPSPACCWTNHSRCGLVPAAAGQTGDLAVPEQGACVPRSPTTPSQPTECSQNRAPSRCLLQCQQRRHSGYRGSMAGPHIPCQRIRSMSRDILRMTRGQRGLLDLRCQRLPLFTPCRPPGALTLLLRLTPSPGSITRIHRAI